MSNVNKNNKYPLPLKQIAVEFLGSIVGVLLFINLLSGIVSNAILVGIYVRAMMNMLCFVLVPAVFALF